MKTTDKRRRELIQHMTGAIPTNQKSKHGFRNHFCAEIGYTDYDDMLLMVGAGLVKAGRIINNSTMQYFHATEAGCEFAGLHKAAVKRALSDE